MTATDKIEGGILPWKCDMFPLVVLFSPGLRLRFRVAWSKAIVQVNDALGKSIFWPPSQATVHESHLYEIKLLEVPSRVVYVCDENGTRQDGLLCLWVQDKSPCSALVVMPDFELDPNHVHGVTIHEVGKVLGLHPTDDQTSIMSKDLFNRPQFLQEKDVETLRSLYAQ